MSDDRSRGAGSLLLAFLAGAAAGAAVALLTSPKSGPQMRDALRSWARDRRTGETIARAARAARDAFSQARER